MPPSDLIPAGTVWLVGAGPGDPDLLTRKAERLIQAASVVFIDALVGPGVIDLIPPHIRRVSVGKRSGRHSKDQGTINDLLVEAALAGERVVRLKGGDPAIFGRATEEMEALAAHGIPVRLCPGITAAAAAAASAGVSLTLRGLSRRLTLVTAHARAGEPLDLDWAALADPAATLAVYMSKAAAAEVSRGLVAGGLPPSTPVLVVGSASLPDERIFETRLDLLGLAAATATGAGPTLLLIGAAVSRKESPERVFAMASASYFTRRKCTRMPPLMAHQTGSSGPDAAPGELAPHRACRAREEALHAPAERAVVGRRAEHDRVAGGQSVEVHRAVVADLDEVTSALATERATASATMAVWP